MVYFDYDGHLGYLFKDFERKLHVFFSHFDLLQIYGVDEIPSVAKKYHS